MTSTMKMWFIRWSPDGYGIYTFNFRDLMRLGTALAYLYFSLTSRVKTEEDIDNIYPLTENEQLINTIIEEEYNKLVDPANHEFKYYTLNYPEFSLYRDITKKFKFVINEPDVVRNVRNVINISSTQADDNTTEYPVVEPDVPISDDILSLLLDTTTI